MVPASPFIFNLPLFFSLFLSSLLVFLSAIFPLLRLSTLVLISLLLLFPSLPRQCVVMHSKENHSKLLGGSGFKEANAVWHGEKFRAVHNPFNPLFLQRVKGRNRRQFNFSFSPSLLDALRRRLFNSLPSPQKSRIRSPLQRVIP